MNAEQLIEKRYSLAISYLSDDDAASVRAYVTSKIEKAEKKGQRIKAFWSTVGESFGYWFIPFGIIVFWGFSMSAMFGSASVDKKVQNRIEEEVAPLFVKLDNANANLAEAQKLANKCVIERDTLLKTILN